MKLYSNPIKFSLCVLIVFATLLTMGAAPSSYAKKAIYVDAVEGSNAYHGYTAASAVKTIQRAIDIASPGTTIYIRRGTYQEALIINHSGTENEPITLTAFSEETVIIDGGADFALTTEGTVDYWIIENLNFHSQNRYTLRLGWWHHSETHNWIVRGNHIYGSNFINGSYHVWEGNEIDGTEYKHGWGDAGITDGGESHHNIYRNNLIHDFTHHNARGIWTQGHTHDSIIANNTIYNILPTTGLGQGIDLDGAGAVEWRHTVIGNTVYNCSYVGIQLENVFASQVENNLIIEGNAGIIIIAYDDNVGCSTGGENNQYGDANGDQNCRGEFSDITIKDNTITTGHTWDPGYGGVVIWYASGITIEDNYISSKTGNFNGGINIQGHDHEVHSIRIINNIISQKDGAAICARNLRIFLEDEYNRFYWSTDDQIYAAGRDCSLRYSLTFYQNTTSKANLSAIITPEFNSLQEWFFCAATATPPQYFQINRQETFQLANPAQDISPAMGIKN